MENRNNRSSFLTFLTALFPGVGYMYLGLIKKGIQVLILYLLIGPLFRTLGLGFLTFVVTVPLWFYTFFDTFSIANKLDRGEQVQDMDFIFKKYMNDGASGIVTKDKVGKNFVQIIAAGLIVIGVMAILHNMSFYSPIYDMIRTAISSYLIPILFVLAGIFILFRSKK